MQTLSYVRGNIEEIEIGEKYYFGQLWDGNGDGEELLASGAISPDGKNVVFFTIFDAVDNIMNTLVTVTSIS